MLKYSTVSVTTVIVTAVMRGQYMHEVIPSAERAAAAAARRAFSILPHVSFFMVIASFS